jgi:predicted nuclease of predicted toxin-antitoxin system
MHPLFLDQNVRIEVGAFLRGDGHTVVHATEAGLRERDDETVFRWAAANRFTVITFDVDFAERAYWNRDPHSGIVRLRLELQTPKHIVPVIRSFLAAYAPEEIRNALVILTESKVRMRRR